MERCITCLKILLDSGHLCSEGGSGRQGEIPWPPTGLHELRYVGKGQVYYSPCRLSECILILCLRLRAGVSAVLYAQLSTYLETLSWHGPRLPYLASFKL